MSSGPMGTTIKYKAQQEVETIINAEPYINTISIRSLYFSVISEEKKFPEHLCSVSFFF